MNQEDGIKQDLKSYQKLDKINKSSEFDDFFQLQITYVVQKMMTCFTGKGPENWDEFCKVRGEVVAALYPIQQVRGAKFMVKQLQEQLDAMYNQKTE